MDGSSLGPAVVDRRIRHGTPAFRRTNLALFSSGFATFGLLYCVQPLLPAFSRGFGVDAAASSLALSLTTGVLAVGMLFAGAISDALGRKPVMLVSLLGSALLVLLTAVAPNWTTLLVLRALLGITLAGLPAVAMTYLSEEVHGESIGFAMGLYIGGNAIGGMGGRLISGFVADHASWRVAVGIIGVLGLVSAALVARGLPPSRHFERRRVDPRAFLASFAMLFRDKGLPWLFAEGFLLMGAFVTIYNYVAFRLLAAPFSLSQSHVGAIFTVYVVGVIGSAWIGSIADRLGRRRVLWATLALMLAGVALTASASLVAIVAGIAMLTFGFFGGHSIASSWVGKRAPFARAHASSFYLFSYYMGSSIAGSLGGIAWTWGGWNGVVGYVAVLVLAGLAIALKLRAVTPFASAA
ncbi:MFS transporter, YNFM family, putative membrane transport protein [Luteibacter sp. UNCMF331Sha3.1]|uniref:MFS transporter n=1 Tax=Luteibacter sp. UNCMF331Sha3.1 TaxID=1502760 RepID=UPI0008C175D6|nr:MFS transporter [Luteibacter sp. UNCMF331Sha3.1]SEM98932.1 MFS transporter, YNFM family, putative membrane transport protein [Luteibacter sp. UNCMF331Sha3.1]